MATVEKKVKTSAGNETASQTVARAKAMLGSSYDSSTKAPSSSRVKEIASQSFVSDSNKKAFGVITPESVAPVETATLPTPAVPTTPGLDLNFNNATLGADTTGLFEIPKIGAETGDSAGVTAAKDSANVIGGYLQNLLPQLKPDDNAQEDAIFAARKQAGVDAAQKEFNRYSGQLNAITAKRDADILSLEGQGRGVTETIIGGQQARINRDAAIQALPIQAQLSAAQGNLEQANVLMGQLYQAKSADITAMQTYKTNLVNSVIQFATTSQQSILQAKQADIAAQTAQAQANLAYQRQLGLQALEYGQNNLITGISSIDPKSKTFEQDIAAYTAQLRKPVAASAAKAPTLQNFGTSDAPDWRQYDYTNGEWVNVSGINNATNPKQAAQLISAQRQLDTLDAISSSKAVDSVVGTSIFSRGAGNFSGVVGRIFGGGTAGATVGAGVGLAGGPFAPISVPVGAAVGFVAGAGTAALQGTKDAFSGDRQQLIADVSNMTTNLSFDKLIQTKAQGATYGSLTEGEWKKIDSSATKLGTWEMKDGNGNVIGYNTSEKNFQREIDTIKYYTKLDAVIKGADPASVGAVQQQDGGWYVRNWDGTYAKLELAQ